MEASLYSGGVGINNKVVSHRLDFGESGVSALEDATDILVGRTGEVVTRRGTSLLEAGVFHSTFKTDGGFYVVKDRDSDSALYRAVVQSNGDITLNGIRSGLSKGNRMSFCVLGDKTYYTNGSDRGFLQIDTSSDWTDSEWTGGDSNRSFNETPVGNHIDVLSGRIALSVGEEIFWTEYGLPGLVDGRRVDIERVHLRLVAQDRHRNVLRLVYRQVRGRLYSRPRRVLLGKLNSASLVVHAARRDIKRFVVSI